MKKYLKAWPCVVGMVAGNFVYQQVFDGDWATAVERSYFQFLMIAAFFAWISSGLSPYRLEDDS